MKTLNIPFLPGDEVGIKGFTSRGHVIGIKLYEYGEATYVIREAWDGGRLIGNFEAHELYSIEDE